MFTNFLTNLQLGFVLVVFLGFLLAFRFEFVR